MDILNSFLFDCLVFCVFEASLESSSSSVWAPNDAVRTRSRWQTEELHSWCAGQSTAGSKMQYFTSDRKYYVWLCVYAETYWMGLCLCVSCVDVAGVSKAQGVDQTSHHQQRAPVRERDPTGPTTGLQQRFIVLPPMNSANMNYCVCAGGE